MMTPGERHRFRVEKGFGVVVVVVVLVVCLET